MPNKRIYLSPPSVSSNERELLMDAFDSNWIAPLGPHVDAFEEEFSDYVGSKHAVALSSGTASLHLALRLLEVEPGDLVVASTLTFVATANVIKYMGANPIFVDSDLRTWNMDPQLLETVLIECEKNGQLPKAIIVVDVNGQCADFDAICQIARQYGVPIIEDAAEALGARIGAQSAGTFGDIGCFSFNGNKIITTSGGGMLVTDRPEWAERARYLASQARMPTVHYEHHEVGYNYRLSNLLAAVGRAQLRSLDNKVQRRRAVFDCYRSELMKVNGIDFMPEPSGYFSTRWLSCITLDPRMSGTTPEEIRQALESHNIESRPVWKPMHRQKCYSNDKFYGNGNSDRLFTNGLCLPSGSDLTSDQLSQITEVILNRINETRKVA